MAARLFVEIDAADPDRASLDAAGARHLRALRLGPGDAIEAIVGPGLLRRGVIERCTRSGAIVRLLEPLPGPTADPPRRTVLALALGDLARMDLVVEKATELGATDLWPVVAGRSQVRRLPEARLARWERIARAACEQCGRTRPPLIEEPAPLGLLAERVPAGSLLVLLRPEPATPPPPPTGNRPLVLVVGPEGGLSAEENAALIASGAAPLSFGPRVLRFETAAIAALAWAAVGGPPRAPDGCGPAGRE